MAQSLQIQAFKRLRTYLFAGHTSESDAPRLVSDQLAVTIDSEKWAPVPQYVARVTVPVPPVGDHALVIFDATVGAATGATPNDPREFDITDIQVKPMGLIGSTGVFSRFSTGGAQSLTGAANPVVAQVSTMVGDTALVFVAASSCGPGIPSNCRLVNNIWNPIPDIEAGNGVQFILDTINIPLSLDVSWSERRAAGR